MIMGVVTADREARLRLIVRGQDSRERVVDAVLDTGFNGYLTLPTSLVAELALEHHSYAIVMLGDGSQVTLSKFEATVAWDGSDRDVLVLAADGDPLAGMALLSGHRSSDHRSCRWGTCDS